MNLSKYTMPKINELRDNLNLSEDEKIVFDMLSKKKSRIEIADKLSVSIRTVDYTIRCLKDKIKQLGDD